DRAPRGVELTRGFFPSSAAAAGVVIQLADEGPDILRHARRRLPRLAAGDFPVVRSWNGFHRGFHRLLPPVVVIGNTSSSASSAWGYTRSAVACAVVASTGGRSVEIADGQRCHSTRRKPSVARGKRCTASARRMHSPRRIAICASL